MLVVDALHDSRIIFSVRANLSSALLPALKQALIIVAAKSQAGGSPQLVWKLQSASGWAGSYEHRPEIVWGFCELMDQIQRFNGLTDAFEREMPGLLNSTVRIDSISAKCTIYTILTGLISTIWHRHDTFIVNDSVLGEVVEELVLFVIFDCVVPTMSHFPMECAFNGYEKMKRHACTVACFLFSKPPSTHQASSHLRERLNSISRSGTNRSPQRPFGHSSPPESGRQKR